VPDQQRKLFLKHAPYRRLEPRWSTMTTRWSAAAGSKTGAIADANIRARNHIVTVQLYNCGHFATK
jgi:hypothetical protein